MITIRIPTSHESERRYILSLLFREFLMDSDQGGGWGRVVEGGLAEARCQRIGHPALRLHNRHREK